MVRLMGLDVGEKRIGIALSDPLGMTAQPHSVLVRSSWEKDMAYFNNLISSYDVSAIVVGVPRRTDGTIGTQGEKVIHWIERFSQNISLPVLQIDEWFSTKASERVLLEADVSRQGRKKVVDKLAAALILEQYLSVEKSSKKE